VKRIILIASIGLLVASASAQAPKRIKFARGAYSSVASGTLTSYQDKKEFVIKVNAGQTMNTEQLGAHDITLSIKDTNGQDVTDSDASCNNRKSVSPTVAGDYRITVVECQKADEWRGKFRFRITVR
jgi:hypothetical protein